MKKPKKINMDRFDDRCKDCDHYIKGKCTGREYNCRPCLVEKKVES